MKATSILIFLCLSLKVIAQSDARIKDARTYLTEKGSIKLPDKAYTFNQKNLFNEQVNSRKRAQLALLQRDDIVDSSRMTELVDSIVRSLKTSNADISPEMQAFVHKSISFNAFTFGDNIIFVNAELVYECRNVHELAYVIAHEIAHNRLSHSDTAIVNYVETTANKEIVSDIKDAASQDYGNVTALNKLMLPVILANKELSRTHEYEADSLGMIYLTNSGYDPEKALEVFEIILYYTTPGNSPLDLSGVDGELSTQLTEKLKYYSRTNSLGFSEKKETEWDEYLTSHPYPDIRYQKIKTDFQLTGASSTGNEKPHGPEIYAEMSGVAFALGKLSIYQFIATENYNRYEQARENLKFGFYVLGVLKERHELGKYVDRQSLYHPEDYDRFCYILNNSSSESLYNFSKSVSIEKLMADAASPQSAIYQILVFASQNNKESVKLVWENHFEEINKSQYSWYLGFLENYLYLAKGYNFVKQPKYNQ